MRKTLRNKTRVVVTAATAAAAAPTVNLVRQQGKADAAATSRCGCGVGASASCFPTRGPSSLLPILITNASQPTHCCCGTNPIHRWLPQCRLDGWNVNWTVSCRLPLPGRRTNSCRHHRLPCLSMWLRGMPHQRSRLNSTRPRSNRSRPPTTPKMPFGGFPRRRIQMNP